MTTPAPTGPPEPAGSRASWRPRRWTAVLLVISATFAAWTFSPIWWSQVGQDAKVYYAAGSLAQAGGDVYDPGQVFAEEDRLFPAGPGTPGLSHTTFAEPPLFVAALDLVAPLPLTRFHLFWLAFSATAAVGALVVLLAAMRWRGRALALAFLLTSPPMLLAVFVGNTSTIVLLGWSIALLLWTRQQPALAGTALGVICWLKPSVGMPIAAALVLAGPAADVGPRIRAAGGLILAAAGLLSLDAVVNGTGALARWGGTLIGYASSLSSSRGSTVFSANMSGLAGLPAIWLGSLSTPVSLGLATLVLAAILLVAVRVSDLTAGIRESPTLGLALLQTAALALSPYLHFNDLVLAALPLLVLASRPLNNLSRVTLILWAVASPARLVLSALLARLAPGVNYAVLPSTGIVLITLTFAALLATLPRRGTRLGLPGTGAEAV